jgi:hypothetical protein
VGVGVELEGHGGDRHGGRECIEGRSDERRTGGATRDSQDVG